MEIEIHATIKEKLNNFLENNNVPHLLFYGPSGAGKKTLVNEYIRSIYSNNEEYRQNVMNVDCVLGKGIQFIREEIKQFAKSHIYSKNKFKTILLYNADKLTIDAQSALRRCIELFSNTTRFFMIVEKKQHLLCPIISRFCEIYVYYPIIKGYNNDRPTNLYNYIKYLFENENKEYNKYCKNRATQLNKRLSICKNEETDIFDVVDDIYQKGYSCYDIINYYKSTTDLKMVYFSIKNHFKNEKLLMYYLLLIIFRSKDNLEISSIITS
jgi:DNA polymerase III delta prime subunit